MAQPPPGVRRGPVLLTGLASIVVLVAALGAVGVLDPPSTAAAAPLSDVSTSESAGAGTFGTDADAGAEADTEADEVAAGETGDDSGSSEVGLGSGVDQPATGSSVTDRLVASTSALTAALAQPVDDTASPAPVDNALVPAAPPTAADPAVVPADSGEGRRVVYSIHGQRVWVVEADGTLVRSYLVSGRLDRPGPGAYEVYSKSPTALSYDSTERMQSLLRFASGETAAIGFHDIPVLADGTPAQTDDLLGQPLSGGSVRQAAADAEFLWGWADLGTTVVVIP